MENLSASAVILLRRRIAREWVRVDERTRPLYEELTEAGMMSPLHALSSGPDSAYRLTDAGVEFGCANGVV